MDKVDKVIYSVLQSIGNAEESGIINAVYATFVRINNNGNLAITQNSKIACTPEQSDYVPKAAELDGTMSA